MRFRPLYLACFVLLTAALAQSAFAAGRKKRIADGRVDLQSEMPPDASHLAIGDPAPDFQLPGVDGRTYRLADFAHAPVLMVVFLSNHCPYSHAAETRLIPLAKEFAGRGLAVVAINPNDPTSVDLGELGYSKYTDSFDDMKRYAKDQGFPFPYLYDGATQATAKAYGCLATPHVFLFDRERRLRYVGRVDDSRFADPATVHSFDARNAVLALLQHRPVPVPITPVMGCSTKWKSAHADVVRDELQADAERVTLAPIDAAGVAMLAKNGTRRWRLINVWATWCAPCVHEFPALVALSRRLGNREFELDTISADDPGQREQAQRFLERQHAAPSRRLRRLLAAEHRQTTHFIYTEASTDALVRALDPEWAGPLPHTILVSPAGRIVYRHTGPVDPTELLDVVMDHLGPYYTPGEKR